MNRFNLFFFATVITFTVSACSSVAPGEPDTKEIYQTEKAFEKMCADKGVAEAFAAFAADSAVIKRGNDSLISGREAIRNYYNSPVYKTAVVKWTPDFIDIAKAGDMAYSYGKYNWTLTDSAGEVTNYTGVYMTVWKRQKDGSWKYVWD